MVIIIKFIFSNQQINCLLFKKFPIMAINYISKDIKFIIIIITINIEFNFKHFIIIINDFFYRLP